MEAQRPGDILIVEQDIHFLTETCNILRNARHNVVSCTTAQEALDHLERIPFDVVLCANQLPDGNGFEICHFIKKAPELRQTSCAIFLDEDVYESHQQQIVDSTYAQGVMPHHEADDFLSRSLSSGELVLRVRAMIRMRRYLEEIHRVIITLMDTAEGAEEQNPHYKGHCKRVASMAVELGLVLGCNEWELSALEKAGYLHDIGLICIPGAIIEKAQPLSPREIQIIRGHCVLGEKLCNPVVALKGALPVIRHHHERLDGSGYPDALASDDVPRLAQIFAMVDMYEGMRLWHPYRNSMNEMQAIKLLAGEVNKGLWNREIFEAFRDKILPGLDARLTSARILWAVSGTAAPV